MLSASHTAEAFFLDTDEGKRFCIFHAADENKKCLGTVLFVPPFGEEMNKSRRMIAMQARSLALHGYAVLLMDLYGCGDSEGEFRDASWQRWKDDLGIACSWLRQRCNAPVSLLALRLGALLALDFMSEQRHPIHNLVLWQPVLNGQQFLTQFFRLQLANHILAGNTKKSGGTQAIRDLLNAGEIIEIAGYEISSRLTAPIDALNGNDFSPQHIPVQWIEIQDTRSESLPPARQKNVDFWTQHKINLQLTQLVGPEFWLTQETTVCDELIALTSSIFGQELK